MACLREYLANRHRDLDGGGVRLEGRAVRVERVQFLLAGDGGFLLLARLRHRLPDEGQRARVGRRATPGLMDDYMANTEQTAADLDTTATSSVTTTEAQRRVHLPGDVHMWVMVLGD